MENKYLTVSALNRYIAYKLENDFALKNIFIKGEISNLRISKGHLYFSLKDESCEVKAIMFASVAINLKFMPVDGMKVLATASISVYQKSGSYNLSVLEMHEAGLGESYLNFLRLKEKLEKEGLFDSKRKLPIPKVIEKIGVVTSPTGDALQDILSTIKKRFPLTEVYIYPALVQGMDAPKSLIRAINRANFDRIVDVIIIARGGGSSEDLSCFNDEDLARTIFASRIPTVSGVGHETDFTICDFVASLRAPTPTGAAVLLTKDQYEIAKIVSEKTALIKLYFKKTLENKFFEYQAIVSKHHFKNFKEIIAQKEKDLNNLIRTLTINSPVAMIERNQNKVDDLLSRIKVYNLDDKLSEQINYINNKTSEMNYFYKQIVKEKEHKFLVNLDKIIILNPLNLMKKGYALTYQDDVLITKLKDVNLQKDLAVNYADGVVYTKPYKKISKHEE